MAQCFTAKELLLSSPRRWWEWRELLVGLALWLSVLSSVLHCWRRIQRRRRPRLLAMLLKDLIVTFSAFLLTGRPCLWLWSFLLAPLWRLLCRCSAFRELDPGPATWEERLAQAIQVWLLLRNSYVSQHGRRLRRRTAERLGTALLTALPPAELRLDFESPQVRADVEMEETRLQELRKESGAILWQLFGSLKLWNGSKGSRTARRAACSQPQSTWPSASLSHVKVRRHEPWP